MKNSLISSALLLGLLIFTAACKDNDKPDPQPQPDPVIPGCVITKLVTTQNNLTYPTDFIYDSTRKLQRINVFNSTNTFAGHLLYNRDAAGNIIRIETVGATNISERMAEYTNYQNGRPGLYKVYRNNNGGWEQTEQSGFEYNAAGQVTKVVTYQQVGTNWTPEEYYTIEYDAQGNPFKSSEYYPKGPGQPDSLAGTLINTFEPKASSLYRFEPLLIDVMDSPEKFFNYHSSHVIKTMTFNNFGPVMGTNQVRTFTYQYDADGKIIKRQATGAYDAMQEDITYNCQ